MNLRCLTRASLVFTILYAFLNAPTAIANDTDLTHSNRLDTLTEQTLEGMLSGDWNTVIEKAEEMVDTFPDYALGQLILAEAHTINAHTEPLLESAANYSTVLVELLLEARTRAHQLAPPHRKLKSESNQLPAGIIQAGKHTDHVVLVDLELSSLYLFDTTAPVPRLIKQHYISSGQAGFGKQVEGDLKTPLGIYRIQDFRPDASLPALYGSGALTLNYPNALDRALGRSGSGIWLHGNPRNNRSRSPRSSEGCVTMANDHLLDLHNQINISRTRVVLADSVRWQNPSQIAIQRDRYQELFNRYRSAWLSNNIVDLMSMYTPDALPSAIHYADAASARKVTSGTPNYSQLISPTGIDLSALANVRIDAISIMLNPSLPHHSLPHNDEVRHLIMEFELNKTPSTRVTLYWEYNEDDVWQIKREEIEAGGA